MLARLTLDLEGLRDLLAECGDWSTQGESGTFCQLEEIFGRRLGHLRESWGSFSRLGEISGREGTNLQELGNNSGNMNKPGFFGRNLGTLRGNEGKLGTRTRSREIVQKSEKAGTEKLCKTRKMQGFCKVQVAMGGSLSPQKTSVGKRARRFLPNSAGCAQFLQKNSMFL